MEILVPKWGGMFAESRRTIERELRFATWLQERIQREKADTRRRMLKTALPYKDVKQRQVGELTLTGIIDGRTFYRWMQTDPHFWEDKGNWKRFVRDNPEVQPWK